jgi:hypothetical protein
VNLNCLSGKMNSTSTIWFSIEKLFPTVPGQLYKASFVVCYICSSNRRPEAFVVSVICRCDVAWRLRRTTSKTTWPEHQATPNYIEDHLTTSNKFEDQAMPNYEEDYLTSWNSWLHCGSGDCSATPNKACINDLLKFSCRWNGYLQ